MAEQIIDSIVSCLGLTVSNVSSATLAAALWSVFTPAEREALFSVVNSIKSRLTEDRPLVGNLYQQHTTEGYTYAIPVELYLDSSEQTLCTSYVTYAEYDDSLGYYASPGGKFLQQWALADLEAHYLAFLVDSIQTFVREQRRQFYSEYSRLLLSNHEHNAERLADLHKTIGLQRRLLDLLEGAV